MTKARSVRLGLSAGLLAAIIAVAGESLGWFNCISVWLIETVVLTLCLAVAARGSRTIVIGSAVLVAYITIISYAVIHGHLSGRWLSDDWTPVVNSFLFLVVIPIVFAAILDFIFTT